MPRWLQRFEAGRLEVKRRVDDWGESCPHPPIDGRVERLQRKGEEQGTASGDPGGFGHSPHMVSRKILSTAGRMVQMGCRWRNIMNWS